MSWGQDNASHSEWLKGLNAGDRVAIKKKYSIYSPEHCISQVARTTKTQIITTCGLRFRIADGNMLGDRRARLLKATDEVFADIERHGRAMAFQNLANRILSKRCVGFDDEIKAILEASAQVLAKGAPNDPEAN